MAVWRKVVVSGSSAELAALKVDNLTSNYAVIGGGQAGNLSPKAISGSGAILADGGSGIQLTGSFSGSFTGPHTGTSSWATNAVTASYVSSSNVYGPNGLNTILSASFAQTASYALNAAALNSITNGEGISTFSYNGSLAATVAISGAADLTDGRYVRWDNVANKLTNGLVYDDGTNVQITGSVITVSGSGTAFNVTGSVRASGGFTGSLFGTSSWATNATTAATASYVSNINQNLSITGSLTLSGSAGPELIVIGETQFTGSVNSLGGFTGSLAGTASWASNAVTASYVTSSNVYGPNGLNSILSSSYSVTSSKALATIGTLTAGNGIAGTAFDGSTNQTFSIGAGALINVDADNVFVITSSLAANQIPKYINNTLSGSNISDTGTQVQIAAGATSGLLVNAGGITVTGNSTFNNNVRITGDLNVAGTASFENTQNLLVGDRFIALASGSTSNTDGGIIVVSSTAANGMSGSAWYLETGTGTNFGTYGRWASAFNVHVSASGVNVTSSEYAVTVNVATSTGPSAAPVWGGSANGSGNMWINDSTGEIFIYS